MTLSLFNNPRTHSSLSEHLNYWEVKDRVMYLREGGAELGYSFTPPSSAFNTESGFLRLYTDLKMTLHTLPTGVRARVVVECLRDKPQITREHFAVKLSSPALERRRNHKEAAWDERIEKGEALQYRFYTSLFIPSKKVKGNVSYTRATFDALQDRVEELGSAYERGLKMARLSPVRMTDQDIFDATWRHFNPEFALTPPTYEDYSMRQYLDEETLKKNPNIQLNTFSRQTIASPIDNSNHRILKVGDRYVGTVSLQGTPKLVWTDMVRDLSTELAKTGMEFKIVADFRHEEEGGIKRKLEAQARTLNSEKKGNTVTDATAGVKEQRIVKGLEAMETGGDVPFATGLGVIFYCDSFEQLRVYPGAVVGALSRMGGKQLQAGSVENGVQFIKHLAPFGGGINKFNFIALERDSADLFPMSGPWKGCAKPVSIFNTRLGTPIGVDYFDPRLKNFNGIISGGAGSGKSMIAQEIITDSLGQGEFVAVVDKGLSYLPLCDLLAEGASRIGKKAVNVISFEPGKTSVNIFALPEGVTTPPDEKKLSVIEFLEALLPQVAEGQGSTRYSLLQSAVEQAYAFYTEEVPGSGGGYVKRLNPFRLSDFVERLHKLDRVGDHELDNNAKNYSRNLATQLSKFCGNTPYGKLLDKDSSEGIQLSGDFTYIEYSAIQKHKELSDVILLLINELIWQRVYRNPGRRSKAFYDETWSLLQHEKAKSVVVRGYREGRKYGMGNWAISQAISDMAGVPGILSSTSIFLLGQGLNEGELLHKLAEFPLEASSQLPTLGAGVKNGREFLLGMRLTEEGLDGAFVGDVIRYQPDPYSYWIYTTNDSDKKLRNQYIEKYGILAGLEQLIQSFKPARA